MNPKDEILKLIKQNGGWVNTHSHLDRSYTLTKENYNDSYLNLKEKWELVDKIKAESTEDQIYERMVKATEFFISQGTQALGSFLDADVIVKDKAINAAKRLLKSHGSQIKLKFANQVLKGVLNKEARYWFDMSLEFIDIVGGLPAKDLGREAEHLDVLLSTAKSRNKLVHVHVDQLNDANEKETELLALKTIEHGMQNKVSAIHSISLAANKQEYRYKIYQLLKQAGITVICCPTAWIDHKRTEILQPFHNSITPVEELVPKQIPVCIGTDNIQDIYKPFSDGDMWTELRVLLEACHYYDIEELVNISTINGLKALGLK